MTVAADFLRRNVTLSLQVDEPRPFRVFTLDEPRRLVVDFEDVLLPDALETTQAPSWAIAELRVGRIDPGWSRMLIELKRPFEVRGAEYRAGGVGQELVVELQRVSREEFARRSGAPPDTWPSTNRQRAPEARILGGKGPLIAIDPGHGGIDPGAVRAGVREKEIVLSFADALRRNITDQHGLRLLLLREADTFLTLQERVDTAEAAGAIAFLSIHANAVSDIDASGAIVFTRSERSSNAAAGASARFENASDRIAGLDANAGFGRTTRILADLASTNIKTRSRDLAQAVIQALPRDTQPIGLGAVQQADFQVLGSPVMASVLLELGFMSNPADLANLRSEAWQDSAARALLDGLADWAAGLGGGGLHP